MSAQPTPTEYELETVPARHDLRVRADHPRPNATRKSGITTVINHTATTDQEQERPAIKTLAYGNDGELSTSRTSSPQDDATGDSSSEGCSRGAAEGCQVHLASSLYGAGGGVEELAAVYPGIAKDFDMHVVVANHVGPVGAWTGCGRPSPPPP
ncbi:hypothetical protein AB0D71_18745 [Streptomyces avermitilis]|uniref:hypothetical protein n=1 Tax=Streptomyces avermitilis TaxID=33903 RepID=UPI00340669A9